jgi:hypothetical protein
MNEQVAYELEDVVLRDDGWVDMSGYHWLPDYEGQVINKKV